MKKLIGLSVLLGSTMLAAGALYAAANDMPDWAYGIPPQGQPPNPPARDDGKMLSVPGSNLQFTFNKIRGRVDNDTPNRTAPADWFPNEHPALPQIVAQGDQSRGIVACSLCHYPNGKGRTENASPAGLPRDYIIRQLHDMKDDMRVSGERRKGNTQQMVSFAKAMTDEEIVQAADLLLLAEMDSMGDGARDQHGSKDPQPGRHDDTADRRSRRDRADRRAHR